MSTRNPTHGTKVTDPNAPEIHEGAGHVAADSLAAESKTFSASNRGGDVDDGPDSSAQDVAGSRKLPAAHDAPSRSSADQDASYPDGVGGQSKATAVADTTGSSVTGGGSTSAAGIAPSYVSSHGKDTKGPHGKNLTEGGFDSDDKHNASWNQDIGGKNDPARLAEQKMAARNAEAIGTVPIRELDSGSGQFDALRS